MAEESWLARIRKERSRMRDRANALQRFSDNVAGMVSGHPTGRDVSNGLINSLIHQSAEVADVLALRMTEILEAEKSGIILALDRSGLPFRPLQTLEPPDEDSNDKGAMLGNEPDKCQD